MHGPMTVSNSICVCNGLSKIGLCVPHRVRQTVAQGQIGSYRGSKRTARTVRRGGIDPLCAELEHVRAIIEHVHGITFKMSALHYHASRSKIDECPGRLTHL